MSLRNIRKIGDDILRKKARPIDKIDERMLILLDDMAETMYQNEGVGLAAPQIGVLRRAVVIDVGEGLVELINPVITAQEGEQTDTEGCLSVPEDIGTVTRPETLTVEATDRTGRRFSEVATGYYARAVCHELDHLDGILFVDKAIALRKKETAQDEEE